MATMKSANQSPNLAEGIDPKVKKGFPQKGRAVNVMRMLRAKEARETPADEAAETPAQQALEARTGIEKHKKPFGGK